MSSVSCVVLKNPSSAYGSRICGSRKPEERNALSAIMWTLGSVLVSFSVQLSNNNTGILVSVTMANFLIMLLATVLLGKGLKESNSYFVLPWILVSFWSMYQIQMRDIFKMYTALLHIKAVSRISWLSLLAYATSFVIRFHLTMTVAYVALQQWYNKKLAQEMQSSLEN